MTNPSRKRVVTSDDLDTLNRNSAYARTQGEAARAAAETAGALLGDVQEAAAAKPDALAAAAARPAAEAAAALLPSLATAHTRADQDHAQTLSVLAAAAQLPAQTEAALQTLYGGTERRGRPQLRRQEVYSGPLAQPGALATRDQGWQVSGASATVTAALIVEAEYQGATGGGVQILAPVFDTGSARVLLPAGGKGWLLKARSTADGSHYVAIWSGAGNALELGISGDGGLAPVATGVAISNAQDAWAEVTVPIWAAGNVLEARYWQADQPRPQAATLNHVLTPADIAALPAPGRVALCSIGGATRYLELRGNWGGANIVERFEARIVGNVAGQGPWSVAGGTGTVQRAALDVLAAYNDPAQLVQLPAQWTEGAFRVLMNQSSRWLLEFKRRASDGASYAVWRADNNLEMGVRPNQWDLKDRNATGINLAGDYWVEVAMGPAYDGAVIAVRTWGANEARPVNASMTMTLNAANDPILSEPGAFRLTAIGAAPARYLAFEVDGLDLPSKATWLGHWAIRYEAGRMCYWTPDQGAEIKFRVLGAPSVTLRCPVTVQTDTLTAPILAYSVDGGPRQLVTLGSVPGNLTEVVIPTPGAGTHSVSIIADGLHEGSNSWVMGYGWCVSEIDAGAGVVTPWASGKATMQIGDSITIAVLGRGKDPTYGSLPYVSAGSLAYPRIAAGILGADLVQVGHGGTGATVSGSGGYPRATEYVFSPMQGHPLIGEPVPDVVCLAHGVNDSGRSVSGADFQAGLSLLAQQVRQRYPAARLAVIRPTNGAYPQECQAVATAYGAAYIDTAGWVTDAQYRTDDVHPNIAGHARAGGLLAAALKNAFGPGFWA